MNFNSQTNIPSFSLQARDWHFLGMIIPTNPIYDDIEYNLKQKFQISNPPIGATLVSVENQYLGIIMNLFYNCHMNYGKEVGKNTRNRFRTALENLALSEITTILSEIDALDITMENYYQEIGRKFLRGKLG